MVDVHGKKFEMRDGVEMQIADGRMIMMEDKKVWVNLRSAGKRQNRSQDRLKAQTGARTALHCRRARRSHRANETATWSTTKLSFSSKPPHALSCSFPRDPKTVFRESDAELLKPCRLGCASPRETARLCFR